MMCLMTRDDLRVAVEEVAAVDTYGVRWELTTIVHDDIQAESHGARQGRWLDLSSHVR